MSNEELLNVLKNRFEKHMHRHDAIEWDDVNKRLQTYPGKLESLKKMELTGGEPDVVQFDQATGEVVFFDCSSESPAGRRNLCYDEDARTARKKHAPTDSAMNMAMSMGIELLTKDDYMALQQLGQFDTKTSSWIKTPQEIRNLGGALFCDRRYDHVFVYHNGAESYYASRGFRGSLNV